MIGFESIGECRVDSVFAPDSGLSGIFWQFVDRGEPDECWPWTAGMAGKYGWFSQGRVGAHVFAWAEAHGAPVPTGAVVMHSCDRPLCCNPTHLSVGTVDENVVDMQTKGRARAEWFYVGPEEHQEIASLLTGGWNRADIAEAYEVHKHVVNQIANEQRRRGHVHGTRR
jgi:hypothetical protein